MRSSICAVRPCLYSRNLVSNQHGGEAEAAPTRFELVIFTFLGPKKLRHDFYLHARVSGCPTHELLPFPFGVYCVHFPKNGRRGDGE